jgi:exonuclease SbcC
MIPKKLQLKNFISYGEIQTIDFAPYHLICLSGKNGHGKSALLDAITWALWGQARKTTGSSKADQGLLRLGQTHMMVLLDFELNNTLYRVRREFAQPYNKPYTTLEFGIYNPETEQLLPLTDKTIRGTQAKIEEILRLDFDSFSNSAFLRQGQSNEFSQKSPKDRKEILATILGLNQYEIIRKRAIEKIRHAGAEQLALKTVQEKITQELTKKDQIIQDIITNTAALEDIKKTLQQLDQTHYALETNRKQLVQEQKEKELLVFHLNKLNEEYAQKQQQLRTLFIQWRTIQRNVRTLNMQTLETEKNFLLQEIAKHQHALQENLRIKEQILKTKEEMQHVAHDHQRTQLQTLQQKQLEIERLQTSYDHIFKTLESTKIQQKQSELEITQLSQELMTLHNQKLDTAVHKQAIALDQHFEKRKNFYQKYIAYGNWLTNELRNLEQKNSLVNHDADSSCPLCEQTLSATRRRFLKHKFSNHIQLLNHQLGRITTILKRLKTILLEQHQEVQVIQKLIEQDAARAIKIEEYAKTKDKLNLSIIKINEQIKTYEHTITEISKQLEIGKKDLIILEQQQQRSLANKPEYCQLQTMLFALEKDLQNTAYNEDKHKGAQQRYAAIEQQLQHATTIHEQKNQNLQRAQEITTLCASLKNIKLELYKIQKLLSAYEHINTKESELCTQEKDLKQKQIIMHEQKESLLQTIGKSQAQQTQMEHLTSEYQKQETHIAQLQSLIDDYQAIAAATSKDGIQALLIEEAIPEIEHEANHLLSKLTNNQAQLFIESLRDLKKGGTKETLDIKISDPAGMRPYELFSGGEAFRIDFALRIAISKLLARRAGTALQTLIIDEGFGSQDEEGLGHIMDALYKIHDDFAKIIIVSHLPSMKDQFPVHFLVEKGPSGSKVQIIEQD